MESTCNYNASATAGQTLHLDAIYRILCSLPSLEVLTAVLCADNGIKRLYWRYRKTIVSRIVATQLRLQPLALSSLLGRPLVDRDIDKLFLWLNQSTKLLNSPEYRSFKSCYIQRLIAAEWSLSKRRFRPKYLSPFVSEVSDVEAARFHRAYVLLSILADRPDDQVSRIVMAPTTPSALIYPAFHLLAIFSTDPNYMTIREVPRSADVWNTVTGGFELPAGLGKGWKSEWLSLMMAEAVQREKVGGRVRDECKVEEVVERNMFAGLWGAGEWDR